jgi:hypothetical protein
MAERLCRMVGRLVAMVGVPVQRMHVSEMHVASDHMMAARAPETHAVHPHAGEAFGAEAASMESASTGAATSAGHDIGQAEQQGHRGSHDDGKKLASDHAHSREGDADRPVGRGKRFI